VKLFYAVLLFVYSSNILRPVYLRRQKFHPRHTRNEKSAPKTDADFRQQKMRVDLWRRFLQCVMGLRIAYVCIYISLGRMQSLLPRDDIYMDKLPSN